MTKMLPVKRAKGARGGWWVGDSGGGGRVCPRQEASIGLKPIFSISCANGTGALNITF